MRTVLDPRQEYQSASEFVRGFSLELVRRSFVSAAIKMFPVRRDPTFYARIFPSAITPHDLISFAYSLLPLHSPDKYHIFAQVEARKAGQRAFTLIKADQTFSWNAKRNLF